MVQVAHEGIARLAWVVIEKFHTNHITHVVFVMEVEIGTPLQLVRHVTATLYTLTHIKHTMLQDEFASVVSLVTPPTVSGEDVTRLIGQLRFL